jgi:hypothetical protein
MELAQWGSGMVDQGPVAHTSQAWMGERNRCHFTVPPRPRYFYLEFIMKTCTILGGGFGSMEEEKFIGSLEVFFL